MHQTPRPSGARNSPTESTNDSKSLDIFTQSGYFTASDGASLFYSVEGKGPPLVFCYGLVCSVLHWTYQIQELRQDHQTIWMDYRGHQNSPLPADFDSVNLERLTLDLEQMLDHLGIPEAVILGHSMGVNVALEFYKKNPHRVKGLVLANGTPHRPLESLVLTNALEPGFNFLSWLGDKQPAALRFLWKSQKRNPLVHSIIGKLGFNSKLTPKADVAQYVDQFADLDPRVFLRLIGAYRDYDCTPWLHEVKVPTLVVAGENDRIIPLYQQEMLNQLIPDSELFVVENGSHCPQMDLPEVVNAKIREFLGRI